MSDPEPITKIVRPLRSGQITIPVEFRKELGISDDSLLRVSLVQGELRIRPVEVREVESGSAWLKALYERFATVRDEAASLDSEGIDGAIDQALARVRESRG